MAPSDDPISETPRTSKSSKKRRASETDASWRIDENAAMQAFGLVDGPGDGLLSVLNPPRESPDCKRLQELGSISIISSGNAGEAIPKPRIFERPKSNGENVVSKHFHMQPPSRRQPQVRIAIPKSYLAAAIEPQQNTDGSLNCANLQVTERPGTPPCAQPSVASAANSPVHVNEATVLDAPKSNEHGLPSSDQGIDRDVPPSETGQMVPIFNFVTTNISPTAEAVEQDDGPGDGTLVVSAQDSSVAENTMAPANADPEEDARCRKKPIEIKGTGSFRVVKGRVDDKPRSTKQRGPAHVVPAAPSSQPTEEDLFLLLMHRTRRRQDEKASLQARQKQLEVRNGQLLEETRSYLEQLDAAQKRSEKQESEIKSYQEEVDEFKARFTKFKAYAKNIANDHTNLGTAIKKMKSSQSILLKDRDTIGEDLQALKHTTVSAVGSLRAVSSKIFEIRHDIEPLQESFNLAQERLRWNEAALKHERVRNTRIEAQILRNIQVQQRQSLAVQHELGRAGAYLDDMTRAIQEIANITGKRKPAADSPGIGKCLEMLQSLKEKGEFSSTINADIKTFVDNISGRLRTYHDAVEESAKAAAIQNEQLGKEIVAQMTTSLNEIGPTIATETAYAGLREKTASLEVTLQISKELLDQVNGSKIASEEREKDASVKVSRLIEELGEVRKAYVPSKEPTQAPTTGPDISMLTNKWMAAHENHMQEHRKVTRKEEEIRRKDAEIKELAEKLKNVQADHKASQSRLQKAQEQTKALESKHSLDLQNARGEAENALQEHVIAQAQVQELNTKLEALSVVSQQTEMVSDLTQKLQAKSIELEELHQRVFVLEEFQIEAERIPNLVQDLEAKSARIAELQSQVEGVANVHAQDATQKLEIKQSHDKIVLLERELESAKQKAALVVDLQKEAAESNESIEALRVKVADYDQLSKLFEAQSETEREQIAQVKDLNAKLADAQLLSTQVPSFNSKADEDALRISELTHELEVVKRGAQIGPVMEGDIEIQETELASLKKKVVELETVINTFNSVREESQQKTAQLTSQKQQVSKLEVDSQRLVELEQRQAQFPAESDFQTKQTTLELHDNIQLEKPLHIHPGSATTLRGEEKQLTVSRLAQICSADRTTIHPSSVFLATQEGVGTAAQNSATRDLSEPQQIPDSQPGEPALTGEQHGNIQNQLQPLSSLGGIQSAQVTKKPIPMLTSSRHERRSSRPPSSSYGGDSMLLEDFEGLETHLKDINAGSSLPKATRGAQYVSQQGQGEKSTPSLPRVLQRVKESIIASGDDPSRRRLRSGQQSQAVDQPLLSEEVSSIFNIIPSSPPGSSREKHLPNSAAKRRLEPIDSTPSADQQVSKRLKRTPANLVVKKASTQVSSSSGTQITEPEISRTSLPSAGRKGSVIGANAPATGRPSGGKKQGRKGLKTERYSARFNQE